MSNSENEELFSFRIGVARRYGVKEAAFVEGLAKLIEQSREDCICEDGMWWFPCAVIEWEGKFPFWTARQVDRIVKNCIHQGIVLQRHYDDDERRRRGWYAIRRGIGYDT